MCSTGQPSINYGQVSMVNQGLGAISSGIGAYYSASAERYNLQSSANMADLNAKIAERTAQSALLQGQSEEQSSRLDTAALKEKQRTAYAGNGIDLSSETANRVLTSTDVIGEIEANTIAANAVRSAWGYRMEATQQKNEALTKRASAKAVNPWERAGTSLINSVGSMSESYYNLKKLGAFDTVLKNGETIHWKQ